MNGYMKKDVNMNKIKIMGKLRKKHIVMKRIQGEAKGDAGEYE